MTDEKKKVTLALQGGGAHGAFTWGVLDAFLEDGRLDVIGISGASAGAMNAVVYADGLREGGPARARAQLQEFWRTVSLGGDLSKAQRELCDMVFGFWDPLKLRKTIAQNAANYFSPYEFNPLDINPLRDLIDGLVDFTALRATDNLKLFISATNVRTGKVRIFRRPELTIDMLMASACLPTLFQAVEVEGEAYWDGGYMGNPALFPLYTETDCCDIILVQINPVERDEIPRTSQEIMDRLNEITFNASLLHEFRAIDFVARLIDAGRLKGTHYKKVLLHLVEGGAAMKRFGADTKLDADYDFLRSLFDIGHEAGKAFLDEHYDAIGVTGTAQLKEQLV
ncbi:patatin [Methylosinus sp. R-45379]|jgi:NTE family protein|uniref:patatin-like phospholipase family protein n=1 Tax=unclassified Methylosinus TaxID=2624500 RepID=UPI0004661850|nr:MULTISPECIES: patatin-like phospholipase family protein [unclassified Methylosinus]OAI23219.1 patatin [Methylosinus sp. R-45379]TDX65795.1 NTE family protein [Methylosinus sp. sav-2]